MRKSFCVLILFVTGMALMALPITILHSGDTVLGSTTEFKMVEEMVLSDFPGTTFVYSKIDLSTGSTLTMDAMLAAGMAPNVFIDTMVRASKYMVPEYALPLDSYIRDLAKYNKGVLDPYKKNGKLLALPKAGGAQGMLVNLDIMKAINFKIPKDWAISDFLVMAELVKQKFGGKKWATGMFAANQSGDYLLNNWFASFGVQFYQNGNYDKAVMADTGGVKVYEFYQLMAKAGYIPPNAANLNDDDYALEWQKGNLAATAFFPDWTKPYFQSAIEQKQIEKPFDYIFVAFPRAPGIKTVPAYISNAAVIVRNTGTPIDKIAARYAEYLLSSKVQGEIVKYTNVVPNRSDIPIVSSDPHVGEVMLIVKENGLMDVGLTDPRFTERRAIQYPILQQVLNFKMTPIDAIKLYQSKMSAVK